MVLLVAPYWPNNTQNGCTGTQLAPGPAQICFPPSEPTSTDTVQDQGGQGVVLLVAPYWPNRTWFPELMLLATAPLWPIPLRKDISLRNSQVWLVQQVQNECAGRQRFRCSACHLGFVTVVNKVLF